MNITYPDVNNGLGCRATLWIAGCTHHCPHCHNKKTWDFMSGKLFTNETKEELLKILSLPYIDGLTLSGGDPIDSYDDVLALVKEIKQILPDKTIWLYTGYEFAELSNTTNHQWKEILDYVDYVVDGLFQEDKKDVSLAFRGSSNQHIWKKTNNIFDIIKLD